MVISAVQLPFNTQCHHTSLSLYVLDLSNGLVFRSHVKSYIRLLYIVVYEGVTGQQSWTIQTSV